jgi:thiol-disulfide isomerase/thioredoxin
VTLPCFSSGQQVRLADLRGPAVINLWASWCRPCRAELPAFQRLATRTSGSLTVVGVNVRDRRDAAQSLAEDLHLAFPTLYDPEQQTLLKLQRNALPLTLFVDARGRVQHLDVSGALDDTALAELVERHLRVAVPS